MDWDEWRAEQINSLVGQISRAVTTNYPGVKVGAMVIVDDLYLDELKFEKLLDWKSWIERDYIDYFLPQINTAKEYDLMLRQMSAVRDTFLPYPVLTLGDDMTRIEFLQSINRLLLRGSLVFKDLDKLDQFSVDLLTKILTKKESTTLHEDPWRALMLNVAEIETQAPASWVADIRQLSEKLSKLVMAPTGSGYIEALAHVRDHIEYLKVKAITDSSAFGNRMDHELIVAKNLLELGASSRTALPQSCCSRRCQGRDTRHRRRARGQSAKQREGWIPRPGALRACCALRPRQRQQRRPEQSHRLRRRHPRLHQRWPARPLRHPSQCRDQI